MHKKWLFKTLMCCIATLRFSFFFINLYDFKYQIIMLYNLYNCLSDGVVNVNQLVEKGNGFEKLFNSILQEDLERRQLESYIQTLVCYFYWYKVKFRTFLVIFMRNNNTMWPSSIGMSYKAQNWNYFFWEKSLYYQH